MFEPPAPALLNTIFVCVVPMVLHPAKDELHVSFIFCLVFESFRIRCCIGCWRFGPERRLFTVIIERHRSCRQEDTFCSTYEMVHTKSFFVYVLKSTNDSALFLSQPRRSTLLKSCDRKDSSKTIVNIKSMNIQEKQT